MADDKLAFELVTPEAILAEGEADMVVVPGGDGNFGVLAGHAPLLSTLRPGLVDVYEGEKVTDSFWVAGGFAEVSESGFTVLADEAIAADEIDAAAAKARLEVALTALTEAEAQDEGVEAATAEVKIAESLVEAAAGR